MTMQQQQQRGRTLVVFDFDWSLLDENSDTWFLQKLLPEAMTEHLPKHDSATETWAQFMDRMLSLVHQRNFRKQDIVKAFEGVPLRGAMLKALELCKECDCELVIMSGANEYFIETILQLNGVREHFTAIHTHWARWTNNERLRISPYHAVDALSIVDEDGFVIGTKHSCRFCTPDLCKGAILQEYLSTGKYGTVFYIGDSTNDLCPSSLLSPYAAPDAINQAGEAKAKEDESQADHDSQPAVKANIHLWESAEDVLGIFQQFLSRGNPV